MRKIIEESRILKLVLTTYLRHTGWRQISWVNYSPIPILA